MAFESFSALVYMEGHGPYVWTCYGAFFLLLGLLAWYSVFERRQVVRAQRDQQPLQTSRQGDSSDWGRSGEASFQRIQSSHSETASKS
ncbi:heme exporter protein CcmD [Marinobacter zhanjiangensis]|uniref:Heme exporter protein D n=1 Tax=Marinobacter zhanjiangensis TaxID=578215 RepID=A0ABQ3ATR9_9GAMM|nr:heme exporter protein CcmD [Marinobacter zhanjiangensis]GGY63880.1 hypothetical protein GCM10007071_08110 [Marinobacter zhanjiangensis]